jgi:hypothetical protein
MTAKRTQQPASPAQAFSPASATTAFPLDSAQKARLLDELDQHLQAEMDMGPKDNDAPAAPGGTPTATPPMGTLSDAASHLAKRLSQARQATTTPTPTPDLGQTTEPSMSNAQPQPPVPVRLLQIERRSGDWGALREQSSAQLNPTHSNPIAPRYRKQIDAYFREVAERGGILPSTP